MSSHALPATGDPAVYIIHDNPEWIAPFTEALDRLGGTSIVLNGPKVHVHVADETGAARALDLLTDYGIARLDMEDLRLHEEAGETALIALAAEEPVPIPPGFPSALAACLAHDPADRPGSAADVVAHRDEERS